MYLAPEPGDTGPLEAWLPSLALVIHVCEELPRFPAWASLRFGTTTPTWFVLSHIPIFIVAFGISWRASCRPAAGGYWWLMALQTALLANGVFHLGAAAVYREYVPGVVSAVIVYVPVSIWLIPHLLDRLGASAFRAVLAGVGAAAVATASLWLDVPVGV